MPSFIEPQAPTLVQKVPEGPDWLYETKYDGWRLQVRVEGGRARIHTRNGHDWTDRFRRLEAEGGELPDCLVDGELVAIGSDGKPNFSELQAAIHARDTDGLVFFAFDLLFEGRNHDLRPFALTSRKARLRSVLDMAPDAIRDTFLLVDELPGPGAALLRAACQMQLEGIVAKRRGDSYRSGRSTSWLKAKCRPSLDVVIGGYRASPFALACGVVEPDGRLRYVGRVKNGFAGRAAAGVAEAVRSRTSNSNPFATGPTPPADLVWIRPELVAEISIEELTAEGKMRHAVFKGLREELTPADLLKR